MTRATRLPLLLCQTYLGCRNDVQQTLKDLSQLATPGPKSRLELLASFSTGRCGRTQCARMARLHRRTLHNSWKTFGNDLLSKLFLTLSRYWGDPTSSQISMTVSGVRSPRKSKTTASTAFVTNSYTGYQYLGLVQQPVAQIFPLLSLRQGPKLAMTANANGTVRLLCHIVIRISCLQSRRKR